MKKSALLNLIILVLTCGVGLAQTTAFTYQGKLTDGGSPANGQYDFKFKLFDLVSGGTQIGGDVLSDDLQVTGGVFTVNLDFGASPFTSGAPRYLEIAVRAGASTGVYTMLLPRQPLTTSPYSIRTLSATSADGLSAVCNPCVFDSQIIAVDGSKVTGIMPNAALAAGNITGILGPLSGGTGIGGVFPVADTFLRSNGTGWTASGLLPSDIPSNFNISGTGSANILNAATQFNLGGNRVLSVRGAENIFVGWNAGDNNDGTNNSFVGNLAGYGNTTGHDNSFFGKRAGLGNVSGNNNTLIGAEAQVGDLNLNFATAIGANAVVSSSNTVVLGRNLDTVQIPGALSVTGGTTFGGTLGANIFNAATQFNIGGNRIMGSPGPGNIFVGETAGISRTSGIANSFFGASAGQANTTGGNNAFFGWGSGSGNIDGNFNSFFGFQTGLGNTTGTKNILIGASAEVGQGNLTNATAIGTQALVAQSNSLVLGSRSGINGATADTNVGIGTSSPEQRLHVAGDEILSTGSQSGFKFRDRGSSVADDWVWYSFGNIARFFRVGVGDLLTIQTNGNVGIGNPNSTDKLNVNGNVSLLLASGGTTQVCQNASFQIATCSSSIRYKENINPFGQGLSLIKQLRPVSFNWRANNQADLGLVAEEVNKVEPLLTTTNDKGEIEGVKYDRIGVVLVIAVQEQQRQIETQRQQINRQQEQIDELKQIVCAIKPDAAVCKETKK